MNTTVYVICALGELEVTTTPSQLDDGVLVFSKDDLFSLNIHLTAGASSTYNVSWGDGKYYIKDQTHLLIPEEFTALYRYEPGNYTVNVTAKAAGGGVRSFSVQIEVLTCLVPEVSFNYGSPNAPITYLRADNILLVGSWSYPSLFCKQLINPQYNFKEWDLQDSQNVSMTSHMDSALKTYDKDYHKVTYTIGKLSVPEGDYHLNLYMEYKGEITKYTAYITILKSEIVADIVNGEFTTVPFKQLKEDGNTTYYNFTFDASNSYDPDEADVKTDGMVFLWECRVITNASIVNFTMTARRTLNKTLYEPDMCLHFNWTKVSEGTQNSITFNTEMFLEGISYEMRVTVKKDTRTGIFEQEVNIAFGSPPIVNIK